MTPTLDLVVHDAREVVVGPDENENGDDDGLRRHENAGIAVVDGRVAAVGPTNELRRAYPPENARESLDATGKTVVPGFVDAHTHACFAGDRSDEFEAKLRGASYGELLAQGGGILRTVRAVRETSTRELTADLLAHLDVMLAHGTTTVEVKSGYGLDTETELRMLRAMADADDAHPVDVVPTFMGAHAVPQGRTGDDYVEDVVCEQLPAVADQGIARFCDVFCDEGAFTPEQSRRVLDAGRDHGLTPKVHAEELAHTGGARLASQVEAASADHLLRATAADVEALVDADVVPVLLPGTAFSLGGDYADARAMLDAGAPAALATDFNPNCFARSMPFAMTLACVGMRLTPAEALVAATAHAARALDFGAGPGGGERGTLREDAPADLAVVDAPSHTHLAYDFDVNRVERVVKGGEVVHRD
ncbi:imidazolonepropionase [Salinigranum rubrum]|uniref:Imidazolonepropionase n=1 Tax=Salinigranum rubrum TaxID=755307 RepID=A0A2I8VEQ3_9EURY|nr:imidazolonepropionase [Salinigranum rubrum]AUV80407.1 imidazolonepropionase [Salinigranum rubrum]